MTVVLTAAWDVLLFLAAKPRPRIVGAQCTNRREPEVARGLEGYRPTSGALVRCGRPVWGDGAGIAPSGMGAGLCSRCLHEYIAFHTPYTTLQANPAASALSGTSIQRRADIFGGLPEVGSERPDTFPEHWSNLA